VQLDTHRDPATVPKRQRAHKGPDIEFSRGGVDVTKVIAHRGASARFRENTLAAFRGAAELGDDGVELDVRRTSDGAGVVHHDADLPDGRAIVSLRADEVPGEVPTLAAALDACGHLDVNVEIKNSRDGADFDERRSLADWTIGEIASWGGGSRVVVSSFDLATIDRIRALAPGLSTAWLVVDRGDPLDLIARTVARGHDGIHPIDRMVDGAFVASAHEAGLFVNVWTVDDPDRIGELASLDVDGVVTNVPDVARAVLGSSLR
jgi:glycerophosphoryl diester phosphodiesterase